MRIHIATLFLESELNNFSINYLIIRRHLLIHRFVPYSNKCRTSCIARRSQRVGHLKKVLEWAENAAVRSRIFGPYCEGEVLKAHLRVACCICVDSVILNGYLENVNS